MSRIKEIIFIKLINIVVLNSDNIIKRTTLTKIKKITQTYNYFNHKYVLFKLLILML